MARRAERIYGHPCTIFTLLIKYHVKYFPYLHFKVREFLCKISNQPLTCLFNEGFFIRREGDMFVAPSAKEIILTIGRKTFYQDEIAEDMMNMMKNKSESYCFRGNL